MVIRALFVTLTTPFFCVRYQNRPPLDHMGPVILAPNHVSYFDPPVLQAATWTHVTFLMTEKYYDFPIARWIFRIWGAIPVAEDRPASRAIKGALRALREGRHVVIFPEGTISDDGFLNPGQAGIAMLIAKARVPIIPVSILGTWDVLPRAGRWPRRHTVTVKFGEPIIPPARLGKAELPVFAESVMDAIAELGAPRRPQPVAP